MTAQTGILQQVRIADLKVHALNPRNDVGDLDELEASIRANGVIEPIVVVKENGHFAVVAGSRRLAAAKRAQLVEIPAVVREMDEREIAAAALVENLQRKDLAPLEEAEGYQHYLDLTGASQVDLARAIGRDPSTVSNALRLLKAPAAVKEALASGALGAAHARELLKIQDETLLGKVKLKKGLTVRDVAAQVTRLNDEWQVTGGPAIERARAFLEEAKVKHPKATFTWPAEDPEAKRENTLEVATALGKPPAPIVGPIYQAKDHDKACRCRAYQIEARTEMLWSDDDEDDRMQLKGFDLQRVCVDPDGFTAYAKASHRGEFSGSTYQPRKKTEAERKREREKKQRDRRDSIARHIKGESENAYMAARRPAPELLKKLTAGGWSSDKVARLLLLSFATERVYTSSEMPEIVRGVLAMPIAKVREIVMERAAARVHSNVTSDYRDNGPHDRRVARHELLTAYGVKSAEPQRKTKAKKKTKR